MTRSEQASPPLRCWAEINLAALERNLKLIRAALPSRMRYVAVVKADAYGHGLPQVAARLLHSGVDLFAVATVAEAAALRELGTGWPILLLSPVLPGEDRFLAEYDLAATVSNEEEVQRFNGTGKSAGRKIAVHLKIDTGMGRLGVWHEQAPRLMAQIYAAPYLHLAGVCTHFSSADDDAAFTTEQRRRFHVALEQCPHFNGNEIFVHADNSAGLETMDGTTVVNAVRVGLLQFGVCPRPGSSLVPVGTEPVFSFHTRVGLVKTLPAGATVSYGRTLMLVRETKIAVLCAGYADGISRAASNRAHVLIHGRRCPVLGRVTMDQTIVDVTELAEVRCGDPVVLIGKQVDERISIGEFSDWGNTIPWETLCAVSKRVPRVYKTTLGT